MLQLAIEDRWPVPLTIVCNIMKLLANLATILKTPKLVSGSGGCTHQSLPDAHL